MLAAGVAAAFLTGDLFNLFVAFEVMLMATYVLITLGARAAQVRTGMTYVVISLLASMLFITAVALIYAATGTVNLADLAVRLGDLPQDLRLVLALLLLVVFGIKSAIFPLFFWLPDSYPTAPTPITAIFAGLLTKVGVYAIIRTQTLLFGTDGPTTVLLWVAALTMLVGVLGAIAQSDIKRILSFHIISQIGYMVIGLALFSLAGLAAAIFYIVHHIVVKTTLFLVGGLVEPTAGPARWNASADSCTAGGPRRPLPPTRPQPGRHPAVLGVRRQARPDPGRPRRWRRPRRGGEPAGQPPHPVLDDQDLGRGVLGEPEPAAPVARPGSRTVVVPLPRVMVAATAATVGLSLLIALRRRPLRPRRAAAADLLDPQIYIDGVLDR